MQPSLATHALARVQADHEVDCLVTTTCTCDLNTYSGALHHSLSGIRCEAEAILASAKIGGRAWLASLSTLDKLQVVL